MRLSFDEEITKYRDSIKNNPRPSKWEGVGPSFTSSKLSKPYRESFSDSYAVLSDFYVVMNDSYAVFNDFYVVLNDSYVVFSFSYETLTVPTGCSMIPTLSSPFTTNDCNDIRIWLTMSSCRRRVQAFWMNIENRPQMHKYFPGKKRKKEVFNENFIY